MNWWSGRLGPEHETADFACGHEPLDRWLKSEAVRAEEAGISATTVWTPAGERRVVAYYSVAPTQIRREELPKGMSGGYSSIPGYLLGRLALHQDLQRQGLGGQLLLDALEVIVAAAAHSAGRVIVVDAIDGAAARFYEHYGFTRIGATDRLALKVATANTALHQARP
jgi:GNAT superfamily N-acetyltransferase